MHLGELLTVWSREVRGPSSSLLLTGMSFTHRDSLARNDRRRDRSGCIHHSRDDYEAPMWRDHKDNSLKEIITLILFRMLHTICHSYSEVGSGLAAVWGSWNNRVCPCAYPCSPCEQTWSLPQLSKRLEWMNVSLKIHFKHKDVHSKMSHYRREGAQPWFSWAAPFSSEFGSF